MNPVLAQPLAEDSPGDSELWTRFCYVRTRDKFCLETTPRTVFISYLHTENLSDFLQPQRMCFCKISNTAASCPFVFLNRKWVNSANRERGEAVHTGRPPRGALTSSGVVSETPATGVPAQQLTPPNPSPQTPPAESGEGPAFGHTLGPVESVTTSHVTGGP